MSEIDKEINSYFEYYRNKKRCSWEVGAEFIISHVEISGVKLSDSVKETIGALCMSIENEGKFGIALNLMKREDE